MRAAAAALVAATALAAQPAAAQDIDAHTIAMIYDAMNGTPPAGVDSAALAAARKVLEEEKLLLSARVPAPEPDFVEAYGKALLLGDRARQFLPELADVRNAAIRRDRVATAGAIERLFAKAGRNKPDATRMVKYVDAVIGAGGDEGPPETVRRKVEKPGRIIEITDAKRAGLFTVEVTSMPAGGGQPTRTVVTAEKTVQPNPQKTGFEQRAVPVAACSVTAAQATERRAVLNGTWRASDGETWEIAGSGDQITLTNNRRDGRPLDYTGTYKLGRLQATHPVTHPDDIGKELPNWVRAGLVGRTAFVVRLDDCQAGRLQGTWESRHVTYSPSYQTISRIHDPYDLRLALARGGSLEVARGGRFPEEGP